MLNDLNAEATLWTTDVIARFEQALGTWAIQGNNYAVSLHHQLSQIRSIADKREYILDQMLPSLLNVQGESALLPATAALKGLVQTWLRDNGLTTTYLTLRAG